MILPGGGQLTGNFQNIITTDVDNNGDLDILIISMLTGLPYPFPFGLDGLAVFRNNGEGVFDVYHLYPADLYFPIYFPKFIYSSDFNNDTFTDIAILADMGGAITFNLGNGLFGTSADTANLEDFWGPENFAPFTGGDFDGDNWIDIAVSGYGIPFEPFDPQFYAVLRNNNSYFSNFYTFYDTLGSYQAIMNENALADLNGNGFLDLVHSGVGVFITLNDIVNSVNDNDKNPNNFILYQNYPNPFNPSTRIQYEIPNTSDVKLKVINILGEEIRMLVDETKSPGRYEVEFNASGLSSGVYIVVLQTPKTYLSRMMLLMK